MADLRELASDAYEGRATGSSGGERAAEYIAKRLREAGLAPVRQDYLFTAGVEMGPKSRLALFFGGSRIEPAPRDDFTALGFSSNGEAEGPIVFAGYGISAPEAGYDDYAAVDVRGKIALVFDRVPREKDAQALFKEGLARYSQVRYKAMNAREHGAAAVIVVAGGDGKDEPNLLSLRATSGMGDAGILVVDLKRSIAERIVASAGRSLAALAEGIDRDFAPRSTALGEARAALTIEVIKEKRVAANVLAAIEGSDEKLRDETIVVGAHYDHLGRGEVGGSLDPHPGKEIHNGADDNASGTAALLEIARAIAAKPARRTVVIAAFSGEELGLLGSAHYVKEPIRPLASTIAMINMDMLGRMRGKKITIGGTGTAEEWPRLVPPVAARLGLEVSFDEEGYGPSDHSSFYAKGVPVLFLFTGAHEDYHRPSDDADKINAEGEAAAAELSLDLLRAIDGMPSRPTWKKTKGAPHGGEIEPGRGPSAYLGTIPDYADTEKPGVRLAGVREESPAEKAGLRAGDRIVRFDGKEIRDVQDYTYALFAKKPGDEVEIVVERGAEKVTLKAMIGRKGAR
jgi:hypothetical protein